MICEFGRGESQGDIQWGRPISPGKFSFRIGRAGEDGVPGQDGVHLQTVLDEGLDKVTMVAVPLVFAAAPHTRLFLYLSCTSRDADSPLAPGVGICKQVSLCAVF